MRGLRDFKVPNFKFPKLKMKELSKIGEVKVDYEVLKKAQENENKKEIKNYIPTNYETIQEIFKKSIKEYSQKEFILEKFEPKGKFEQISYAQFGEDVIAFGTALKRKLNLNENARILIISETTYHWYVSYMTLLCGDIIAVPTDKELPENRNITRRTRCPISALRSDRGSVWALSARTVPASLRS